MARIAVSIQNLADEVHALSPQTTIYFYDNGSARDSDHDPNAAGVICACDIMQGHGLDLGALAQKIVDRRHPDTKYVIYNRRIASRNTNREWVPYHGESDHTDHIHVSVGVGRDGYSTPPYDSPDPWNIAGGEGMTPAQAYVLHVINYRVDGMVGNKPVITIPAFKYEGQSWPQIVQTNQLYLALQAADDNIDASQIAREVVEAIGDISIPGSVTEAQVQEIVQAVINRTHLTVQGEV